MTRVGKIQFTQLGKFGPSLTLEPQPVRIFAARFIQVDAWSMPRYFALKAGEFIQGLLATITHHKRVYVVTVPLPVEHAGEAWQWPRVVT